MTNSAETRTGETVPPQAPPVQGTKGIFHPSDKYWKLTLALLMLGWVLLLSGAAWLKLHSLGMGFDLGMYEQVIWNTAHGHPFATSAFRYTTNHIGADLIVLEALVAPFYGLVPNTMTLLVLQVISVALGALPLYLLARDRLKSNWAGLLFAAAYLAYVPLLYLTLDEFQPRAFALACVLFSLYYLDKTRFRYYFLFLFLALLTRSDVALFVVMMGVLAFLWRKPLKFSVVPFVVGSIWFVAAIFFIVPHFQASGTFIYFETYGWLGKTPGAMLLTVLTRPLFVLPVVFSPPKVEFLWQVFGPTLPWSLLRPDVLLLGLPTFALNLLSQYNVQSNITRQYSAMLYPVVYASAVLGIAWLTGQKWLLARMPYNIQKIPSAYFVNAVAVMVLGLTLAQSFTLGNPVVSAYRKPPSSRVDAVEELLQSVPPNAHLAISNHVGPFAAQREGFYFFPPHQYYTHNTFEVADYILVDTRSDGTSAGVPEGLTRLKTDGAWELVAQRDGYVLYHKK